MITLYSLFQAVFISLGIWMNLKFCWMIYYQIRFGGNTGDLYITGRLSKEDKRRLKENVRKRSYQK